MSDKYKMITELGLKPSTINGSNNFYVEANELESLLAKRVRVLSFGGLNKWAAALDYNEIATHTALLLDMKPIPKLEAVSIDDLRNTIYRYVQAMRVNGDKPECERAKVILKRLEDAGIK